MLKEELIRGILRLNTNVGDWKLLDNYLNNISKDTVKIMINQIHVNDDLVLSLAYFLASHLIWYINKLIFFQNFMTLTVLMIGILKPDLMYDFRLITTVKKQS